MLVIPKKKRRIRISTQSKHFPGLEHLDEHLNDAFRSSHLFQTFSPTLQQKLYKISSPASYRKGQILFAEGEAARGVFLVEEGRVKLGAESPDGKSLIVHMAIPGDIVGIPAAVSGRSYEVTAEALETTQVRFVSRKSFVQWIEVNGEAGLRTAEILSDIYYAAYAELRYLGLSTSAEARLARFLLAKTLNHNSHGANHQPVKIHMTHQHMAAVIGLSRETVTRVLSEFRRKGLVKPQNSHLTIENALGLRELVI
ncbi:MAG TPA: Crp/Fnr family transcriptional regulator [Terriglobales bacterium]|nr:Crp/Fnr family transcriptional regulator [Terriglobales bacterium]